MIIQQTIQGWCWSHWYPLFLLFFQWFFGGEQWNEMYYFLLWHCHQFIYEFIECNGYCSLLIICCCIVKLGEKSNPYAMCNVCECLNWRSFWIQFQFLVSNYILIKCSWSRGLGKKLWCSWRWGKLNLLFQWSEYCARKGEREKNEYQFLEPIWYATTYKIKIWEEEEESHSLVNDKIK